jgi:hypothetical protein
MKTIEELEARLSQPSDALIKDMAHLDGDIMLLGVGGKMGPSLARLAMNAIRAAGVFFGRLEAGIGVRWG